MNNKAKKMFCPALSQMTDLKQMVWVYSLWFCVAHSVALRTNIIILTKVHTSCLCTIMRKICLQSSLDLSVRAPFTINEYVSVQRHKNMIDHCYFSFFQQYPTNAVKIKFILEKHYNLKEKKIIFSSLNYNVTLNCFL